MKHGSSKSCAWCGEELVTNYQRQAYHAQCQRDRYHQRTNHTKSEKEHNAEIEALLIKTLPELFG